MKYFLLSLILLFSIIFIQAQRPQNIRIFNVEFKEGKLFYEYTVFKNEIFAFQFQILRGNYHYWAHLNDSLLKEPKIITFLNSSSYFWGDERIAKTQIVFSPVTNETSIVVIDNHPIVGGSEEYYEIFKALDVTKEPELLHFIYTSDLDTIGDVSVNLWVCDEIYKDQCINNETAKCVYNKESNSCISKTLCDKVKKASKSSCENAVTSTPSLTKCIFEKLEEDSNTQENCTIKKLCIDSLTEEECNSAVTINPNISKCIFNKKENICESKEILESDEINKSDEFIESDEINESDEIIEIQANDDVYYKVNNLIFLLTDLLLLI